VSPPYRGGGFERSWDPESYASGSVATGSPPMVSPSYRVGGFERSWDPESYAGGSVATGSVTHAGQVKG
jgi:hypothetical protein